MTKPCLEVPLFKEPKAYDTTVSPSLQYALNRLDAKRQGTLLAVNVSDEGPANLEDLSNLKLTSCCGNGSNNTLDTLNSSVEMLKPEEAAKLSPTNAPVMKSSSLVKKKPASVKSI